MNAKCGGGWKPEGTKAEEEWAASIPVPLSQHSGPRGWTRFSPRDVYRLTHFPYKWISQHLPCSTSFPMSGLVPLLPAPLHSN